MCISSSGVVVCPTLWAWLGMWGGKGGGAWAVATAMSRAPNINYMHSWQSRTSRAVVGFKPSVRVRPVRGKVTKAKQAFLSRLVHCDVAGSPLADLNALLQHHNLSLHMTKARTCESVTCPKLCWPSTRNITTQTEQGKAEARLYMSKRQHHLGLHHSATSLVGHAEQSSPWPCTVLC